MTTEFDDRSRLEIPCLPSSMSAPWKARDGDGVHVLSRGKTDGVPFAAYRIGSSVREWRGLVPSYLAGDPEVRR